MDTKNEGLETNESLQADEVQALSAIFGTDWVVEDVEHRVYSIKISKNSGNDVYFQVTLPENYPLYAPPIYQISAPWMSRGAKRRLCSEIEEIYCQNAGESIIYLWIEKIQDFMEEETCNKFVDNSVNETSTTECSDTLQSFSESACQMDELDELPPIEHGEPIIDRKSVFQAHVAKVITVNQVKRVLEKLKENRKIATATHNIYAYRIARENSGTFFQDCEDDGETKAGSVLLHLLQILEATDVLVVVSRWYGGIHLGPDRFKQINNAARTLLSQLGYVKNEKVRSGSSKVGKK